MFCGGTVCVDMPESATVGSLKSVIEEREGVPSTEQVNINICLCLRVISLSISITIYIICMCMYAYYILFLY